MGILEIKCLYKYKDDEKIGKVKYLTKDGILSKKSVYYTQIQMNCWLVNAKFAYLFLYIERDYRMVPVDIDMDFA